MVSSRQISYAFLLVVSGYLLLWVAVLNGYPVFFSDSAGYLKVSFTLLQPIFRTISYSVFIRLINFETSPWLVVIVQSVIAIFVLHSAFRLIIRQWVPVEHDGLVFLGLIAFLAFGTTLPWYVGQIMPDVFTGLTLLSFFLLLYDSEMRLGRTILTCFVFCISVGAHITHLMAVSVVLVAVLTFWKLRVFREFRPTRSPRDLVAFVLIPMLVVTALIALSNRRAGLGFTLSPGRHVFLFARLMQSGLAPTYLQQRCKTEELTPCKYLQSLPKSADVLLWSDYPLLKDMGGWYGASDEASRIVSGTIRYNPVGFVKESVKQMFLQFVVFADGSENRPVLSAGEIDAFRELYPGEMPRYLLSRQSIGKLLRDAEGMKPVYLAVFWCSLGVSLVGLFRGRLRMGTANQLFVLTLIFLFANALLTGALSGVHNRYQARVSWLMAMCCAAYVIPYFAHWQSRVTHSELEAGLNG
jgi:hypothetical protein